MIVLFGSTGYVGQSIASALRTANIDFKPVSRQQVDLGNSTSIATTLLDLQASFLINCAGYTGKPNVDACELEKAECLHGNAVIPGRIREACDRQGIPFGHVSSGCTFTGSRPDGSGFTEQDSPNFSFRTDNCSFYSGTKALGEEVLADCGNCYIWRLRIPFNDVDSPRNYLSKVQRYDRLLQATNSLSHLDEFAAACVRSWTDRIPFGTYNVVNGGPVTTRRVTELIANQLPRDKAYQFFDDESEFMQVAAKTPRSNCVLDNSKLLATGIPMRPVEEAIEASLKTWKWESA